MKLAATLAALTIAGALTASPAKADPVDSYAAYNAPRVCATLAAYPSFAGIAGVGDAIVAETGWTYSAAGRVIAEAVYGFCPQFLPLLANFANTYSGQHAI